MGFAHWCQASQGSRGQRPPCWFRLTLSRSPSSVVQPAAAACARGPVCAGSVPSPLAWPMVRGPHHWVLSQGRCFYISEGAPLISCLKGTAG